MLNNYFYNVPKEQLETDENEEIKLLIINI